MKAPVDVILVKPFLVISAIGDALRRIFAKYPTSTGRHEKGNPIFGEQADRLSWSGIFHLFYQQTIVESEEKYQDDGEWEALKIVYVVQKFRNYLLASQFTFYVDHYALMYVVDKVQILHRPLGIDVEKHWRLSVNITVSRRDVAG